MPYSGADDSKLPDHIKSMPMNKRKQWVHVFNSSMMAGDDESTAFAKANGTVKKKGLLYDWYDLDSRQLSFPDVSYNPMGGTTDRACSGCHWYVSPDSCVVVYGDVAPNGVCSKFMTSPVPEVTPLLVQVVKEKEDNLVDRLMIHIKQFFGSGAAKETATTDTNVEIDTATPIPPVQGSLKLYKSDDGKLRFFATYSNNFKDKHKEIIEAAAHQEFVDYCTTKEAYPELQIWHCGTKSKWGQVDWIDFLEGFVAVSGTIDDDKVDIAEALQSEELAVSHGFYAVSDKEVIKKYRSFEISVLPKWAAANEYTDFNITTKEFEMPFSDTKRQWLKDHAGISDEIISEWESDIEKTANQLKQLGLEWKSSETTEEQTPSQEQSIAPEVTALTKSVGDLTTVITRMKEELDTLKKSKDEMISDVYTAAVAKLPQGFVPTQDDNNVVEHKEKDRDISWFGDIVLKELGK